MKKLFCIMGRSCTGKTTLAKLISEELGLRITRSYTTRPMRVGETPYGSDHYFIDKEDVQHYRNKITHTEINGYKYFVTRDELEQSDIYVVDPIVYQRLSENIKKSRIKIQLIPIYITVSEEKRKLRGMLRCHGSKKYLERFKQEDAQFTEFEENMGMYGNSYAVKVINNDKLRFSVPEIRRYIIINLSLWKRFKVLAKRFLMK